jgi:hypothetical protein
MSAPLISSLSAATAVAETLMNALYARPCPY